MSVRASFALVLLVASGAFAADDYLSAIEAESEKVEGQPQQVDKAVEEAVPAEVGGTGNDANSEERIAFENLLKERFLGTYNFFNKLPERSRQEIVQEYRRGTSIVRIRKKIVDRFMQR